MTKREVTCPHRNVGWCVDGFYLCACGKRWHKAWGGWPKGPPERLATQIAERGRGLRRPA